MAEHNRKVVKYRKPIRVNIGVVVFLIIFIYIIIISFQYFNKEHVSIYEVLEKSIADDNVNEGIILRKETIFKTQNAGYINYYVGEGNKVGKNATVYTVDESGSVYKTLSESKTNHNITTEDSQKIRHDISSFKSLYSDSDFDLVTKDFTYDIQSTTLELTSVNMMTNLQSYLKDNNNSSSFDIVTSTMSGIISYYIDGMEDLTQDQITEEIFLQENYKKQQLRSSSALAKDSPVYKLVTDELWSIILPITDSQYEKVSQRDRINIRFPKVDITTSAAISTFKKGDAYYAKLDMNRYMINFINQRFIEVELLINAAQGLKIPVSSILKKDFYLIPIDYFTEGGDSKSNGIIKETPLENGNKEYAFLAADIYYQDKDYGYIDVDLLSSGDWIINEKTQERYQITETKPLEGVYNVNKGYCVFKRIEKIYENEEYCIIEKETSYGLSTYDHIVVKADLVNEQDIIY